MKYLHFNPRPQTVENIQTLHYEELIIQSTYNKNSGQRRTLDSKMDKIYCQTQMTNKH